MAYVIAHFAPWIFLGALGLGLLVGLLTWDRKTSGSWLSGWLRWAAILFVVAVFAAIFKLIAGRGGLWLETALIMFAVYIVACILGSWLRGLLAASEPVLSGVTRMASGGAMAAAAQPGAARDSGGARATGSGLSASPAWEFPAAPENAPLAIDSSRAYPGQRPVGLAKPEGAPDDLTHLGVLSGSDQKILNDLGIHHVRQISGWSAGNAEWINHHFARPGRVQSEGWIGKAAAFGSGNAGKGSIAGANGSAGTSQGTDSGGIGGGGSRDGSGAAGAGTAALLAQNGGTAISGASDAAATASSGGGVSSAVGGAANAATTGASATAAASAQAAGASSAAGTGSSSGGASSGAGAAGSSPATGVSGTSASVLAAGASAAAGTGLSGGSALSAAAAGAPATGGAGTAASASTLGASSAAGTGSSSRGASTGTGAVGTSPTTGGSGTAASASTAGGSAGTTSGGHANAGTSVALGATAVAATTAMAAQAAAHSSSHDAMAGLAVPGDVNAAHPGERPLGLLAARGGAGDDLKRIRGISPDNERALNRLGIHHYDQIAELKPGQSQWLNSFLGSLGRIERDNWVTQAHGLNQSQRNEAQQAAAASAANVQAAASDAVKAHAATLAAAAPLAMAGAAVVTAHVLSAAELSALDGKYAGKRPIGLTAPRSGEPDDLLKIRGVGKANLHQLHALGVFHFDQITKWSKEELRWVGSYMAFPGRLEKEDWIGQAKHFAQRRVIELANRVASAKKS